MILISLTNSVATLQQLIIVLAICFTIAYIVVFMRVIRDKVRDNLSYRQAIYKRSAPLLSITIILLVVTLLMLLN